MALDIASLSTSLPHIAAEPTHSQAVAQAQAVAALAAEQAAGASDTTTRPAEPARPVVPKDLERTVQEMQQVSAAFNRRLSFSINEKLDTVVVKVVDTQTDKVVREIPPAELQHVYEAIKDAIGLLFDNKA